MDLVALWDCLTSPSCVVTQGGAGLISGFTLFLVAAGLTIIFGVLNFVNFVHGAFYMFGAYFAYTAYGLTSSYIVAVFAGAIGVGILGALFEMGFVRRLYDADHLLQILVCYAFILIFDDIVRLIWGAEFVAMGVPESLQLTPLFIFGGVVPPFYLVLIGTAAVIAIAVSLLLHRTRYGKTVRALAVNPAMVGSLGVNTRLIYVSVFALGAMLAGTAGALAAPVRSMSSGMGFSILIESFIVTVIGGMGSIAGALIASLLIGLMRAFGSVGFPSFAEGLIFLLMIAVLLLRPQGLFGREVREV